MKRRKILAVLILALVFTGQAHAALPETSATITAANNAAATNVVKGFYAQLTDVMKQGDQLGFSGRFKKLEPVVKTAFNLPLMTRVAVGLDWTKATPAEQQQLTSAFSDFSVANYASRFAKYNGEQFEVTGTQPTNGGVIVETRLTPKEGDPVALNYLMRTDEKGSWRIVDVFLDGSISELATRRAEFSSIVNRDGIEALVNSLGDKAKQMGPS